MIDFKQLPITAVTGEQQVFKLHFIGRKLNWTGVILMEIDLGIGIRNRNRPCLVGAENVLFPENIFIFLPFLI